MKQAAFIAYQLGVFGTFIYLTFLDGYIYTWWNWLIALPINALLSTIWPLYWPILRPLMGA